MNIELGKNISPREIETRIQKFWDKNKFWENDVASNKPAFCTMMPPPNLTGNLHMGHAMDNIVTDYIARYKRMAGFDVLWQPGTDHASIAMQLLVERDLSKQGINPRALTKEELLSHAWTWKDARGDEILKQMRMMGVTPAWGRARFTMDAGMSAAVIKLFVRMYDDGLIYKAKRLVNWCPKQRTTISDLEIEFREEKGKFYFFKYPVKDGGFIDIATTRPETLFGDGGIAIHPENEKLKHLIGQIAIIPLTDIEIPIIGDKHANPDKGSGAVKISPMHDMNDWEVGIRNNLRQVCVLTDDAHMADVPQVPEKYRGMERYKARAEIVADIEATGLLSRIEDKIIPMPYSQRGQCVIEYMPREEWFVDAKKLAKPVIAAVKRGELKFLPDHRQNLFMSWMNNIHEWSISRQLWWGHQIPAWYDDDGKIYVAESEEDAIKKSGGKKLTRDASVLDTWFSSGLWPFSTLGWPSETLELKKYYPTDFLNTGVDLIFFWVARMCIMGMYATGKLPFKTVYMHGMVRDKNNKKMSKTTGNGVDPDEIIEKYGADALRYWVSTTPIGQDVKYSEEEVKRGSKLLTKLWNAAKFVLMNLEGFNPNDTFAELSIEDKWVLKELNKTIAETRKHMDKYDTFNARGEIDSFFWDIFCDQYLEFVKMRILDDENKLAAQQTLYWILFNILQLYAPFIPFLTEELYQKIYADETKTIHLTKYPEVIEAQLNFDVSEMGVAMEILRQVRAIRSERKIGGGAKLEKLIVPKDTPELLFGLLKSGARAESIEPGMELDFVVKAQ